MKKGYVLFGALVLVLLLVNFMFFSGNDESITGRAVDVGSAGSIEIKGSDTLLQLVSNLAEAYSEQNGAAKISVTGGGSGTGIAALLNGEVSIADSSRKIKDKEISQARELGVEPIEVRVARDMLSVIVHEENGVTELTKEEIGAIYRGEITNWQDVDGKDMEITLYGRQSTSGTYVFFLEEVVVDKAKDAGEYSPAMRNMEGNQAILEGVRSDVSGIGYVGLGYVMDRSGSAVQGVSVVSVSESGDSISPLDEARRAEYPISRSLFQYLSGRPMEGTATYDFIMFELSDEGQRIVEETGFVAITDEDKAMNEQLLGA